VFFGDRRVLHRHRPAGEINHPSAVLNVPIMKRGAGQFSRHHRRQATTAVGRTV
jgi:hypothetical protein